jgi:hypothetical protein
MCQVTLPYQLARYPARSVIECLCKVFIVSCGSNDCRLSYQGSRATDAHHKRSVSPCIKAAVQPFVGGKWPVYLLPNLAVPKNVWQNAFLEPKYIHNQTGKGSVVGQPHKPKHQQEHLSAHIFWYMREIIAYLSHRSPMIGLSNTRQRYISTINSLLARP